MPNIKQCLFYLAVLCFGACQQPASTNVQKNNSDYFAQQDSGIQNGQIKMVNIETPKGKFQVWTKRFGLHPTIKILLLNGGPGATHEYFECFENFLPAEGIEFIYYDQLGCGNSSQVSDTSLWDLDRYVEEVEQVRKALQLDQNNFYLLGHSWGGILAMQYALKYQANLKGLIISNMMSSCPKYGQYANDVLAKQFEPTILDSIRLLEKNKDFSNPRYMALLMPNFYAKHICRIPLDQWPEPVNRSFAKINQSLYVTMQGPSEFGISGKLEKWDVGSLLPNISVPTLTIGATHDTMDPEHMKWMSTQVKKGRFLLCPNGSHMSMYDDQKVYM
ncbi:MAG: hypothetical protein RLY16_641, partial [Bacteroidota bacterium]